ncbi:hypothetical protein ACFQ1E_02935 [Sphingomonas canadensis]|uniref:DUF4199 domain-containing protein n=1 Tax=Sphingomonas canadensis TaxID=1219257 RepID=A0ABW3H558_9SPHN|nr:hypothetical protein [Sphingomonas canadensis]MCW3834802.1 hypothetical protein [Sphingomonas canadensis]
MKDLKTIALAGAALLFAGVFTPIISVPIVGQMNYFQNGKGDGIFILILAGVAAALALFGQVRHVLWPGAASLALLAFTFIRFQQGMAEMRAQMETDLADNPFKGLAEAAIGAVQLQWGWAVLVIGGAMTTYAGAAAFLRNRRGNE